MNEIKSNGTRDVEDYSVIIYIVQKGDTLWNIAKKFGSNKNNTYLCTVKF